MKINRGAFLYHEKFNLKNQDVSFPVSAATVSIRQPDTKKQAIKQNPKRPGKKAHPDH